MPARRVELPTFALRRPAERNPAGGEPLLMRCSTSRSPGVKRTQLISASFCSSGSSPRMSPQALSAPTDQRVRTQVAYPRCWLI